MVQTKRFMTIALFTAIAFCGTSYCAKSADAQHWRPVYKVQVQYCFYDYDYYYWSTVLETYDHNEAFWACCFLLVDKDEGTLNEKVPHANPKYVAVDVRYFWDYEWVPGPFDHLLPGLIGP